MILKQLSALKALGKAGELPNRMLSDLEQLTSAVVKASPGKRRDYSAQVWLTVKQRQELSRRAKAEMRTRGNYVTAVVLGALREG